METTLYVGIGGFLGANARYYLSTVITARVAAATGWTLPMGTLAVNALGSFLLAVFSVWVSKRLDIAPTLRLLIGTGFFGAFTTFSTFANESVSLAQRETLITGALYVIVTNAICLIGVLIGLAVAQRL